MMTCCVISGLLVMCATPQDSTVAEVGAHRISSAAFRTYIEGLPAGFRPLKTADETRQHHLQVLIDRRLLLMESEFLGLDTLHSVRMAVKEAVEARVIGLYRSREIGSKVVVDDDEIQRHFVSQGYDKERRFHAILVRSRSAIDSVVAELAAGRPFGEVARSHSINARSAEQDGELGFMGRDRAPRFHVPPEVFRDLPTGQVSAPLPAGRNWHVVLFTEDRPADLVKYRDAIRTELYRRRRQEVAAAHYELLESSLDVRLHGAILHRLVAAYRAREPGELREDPTPVYTWSQGTITLAGVQAVLERFNITAGLSDSTQAAATVRNFALIPFLVLQGASDAGYDELPEIVRLRRKKREEVLLETLRATVAAQRITIEEADVRRFYDDHPQFFQHEPAAWVEELLLPNSEQASRLKQELEAGAPVTDYLDRSLRSDAVAHDGRFHFHLQDTLRYPTLVSRVMEASPGAWTGPVAVDGGYSVSRVAEHEKSAPESFEDASQRARALLYRELDGQILEEFLAELRNKYASRVTVYLDRLAKAAPDTLLQG
jgi:parvulin-like peptidyl-prolyl isomerase